jgi:hypothetical protein
MSIATEAICKPEPVIDDDSVPSGSDYLCEYFRGTQGNIYLACIRNTDSKLPRGEIANQVTRSIKK